MGFFGIIPFYTLKQKRVWQIIFLALSAWHLAMLTGSNFELIALSKISTLPCLAIGTLVILDKKHWRTYTFTAAFITSWIGDWVLIYQSEDPLYFVFGLISFLLAHILFSVSFFVTNSQLRWYSKAPGILVLLLLLGLSFAYFGVLMPHLGVLKPAVGFYFCVILSMVLIALSLRPELKKSTYRILGLGVISFLISDGILAYNKFYHSIEQAGIWIMFSYLLAQFCLFTAGTSLIKAKSDH